MYRPLPEGLTIRDSHIEGLGLFATKDFEEGFVFGRTHLFVNDVWVRTPLGGFYNHTENPNAGTEELLVQYDKRYQKEMQLRALRDIKAEEEITVTYTLYQIGV